MDAKKDDLPHCRICSNEAELFDRATVLSKYDVAYYRCANCGFVQTETPYWLDEAYTKAINAVDTGIMQRNLLHRRITSSIIELLFPEARPVLDYGAGHGIFVRLMRDLGYDFYWYDLYASNDYALGFEHRNGNVYDLVTSFEVLEHLSDPLDQLSRMMSLSANVLVSTELLPERAPKISDWWYYTPAHGQHISFYTQKALRTVAQHFGRRLLSRGTIHLFTKEPKNNLMFRLAVNHRVAALIRVLRSRPSLTMPDHYRMTQEGPGGASQAKA